MSAVYSKRRIDDDRGKSYELGQSTVFGMRGILCCWLRQSSRLEQFKNKQSPKQALHSKFHLDTGAEVYTAEDYNHLQIDIVSLYLLFLVQAISSGLYIIYSMDEVNFIQNLVFYVERAYRTPDFGMWERGSKYNDGTCEVNARCVKQILSMKILLHSYFRKFQLNWYGQGCSRSHKWLQPFRRQGRILVRGLRGH